MKYRFCLLLLFIFVIFSGFPLFASDGSLYVVRKGDTIWDIAYRFRVSVKDIIAVNNLKHPERLKIGQKLLIPVSKASNLTKKPARKKEERKIYVMRPGDTLWDIARMYSISVNRIIKMNHIDNPSLLRPGTRIILPETVSTKPERKTKVIKYVVKKGDTLWDIARKYHVRVADLMVSNNIVNPARLRPGDVLTIGGESSIRKGHSVSRIRYIHYRLRPGDNLWIIARRFHVSFYTLLQMNHVKSPRLLQIGQLIKIPVKPGVKFNKVAYPQHGYRTKMSSFLRRVSNLSRHVGEGRFIWPTTGRITSGFGWRRNPFRRYKWEFHPGIDIATYIGKSVVAADRGKVVYSGWMAGYGRIVIIDHGGGWITTYGHLHRIYVKKGQWVYRGQRIGSVGSTGRSTGPHLFFEVYYKGRAVNPLKVLRDRYVSATKKGDNG